MWEGAWQLPVTITAEILIPALAKRWTEEGAT
jgi:hypothetical protein